MRFILEAFWVVTCWAAAMFTAPMKLFVYLQSLLLWWSETHWSKETRSVGRGHPDTGFLS